MLFATELVGAAAYDSQNHFVGRVREFFVEPAEQPNRDFALSDFARPISAAGGEV